MVGLARTKNEAGWGAGEPQLRASTILPVQLELEAVQYKLRTSDDVKGAATSKYSTEQTTGSRIQLEREDASCEDPCVALLPNGFSDAVCSMSPLSRIAHRQAHTGAEASGTQPHRPAPERHRVQPVGSLWAPRVE